MRFRWEARVPRSKTARKSCSMGFTRTRKLSCLISPVSRVDVGGRHAVAERVYVDLEPVRIGTAAQIVPVHQLDAQGKFTREFSIGKSIEGLAILSPVHRVDI